MLRVEPLQFGSDHDLTDHVASRPCRFRPGRCAPAPRPRPRRRRRRRALPRIRPVRDAAVRQRTAQAGDLQHRPGLRAARGQGRGGRLRPFLRPLGAGAGARGGRGARGQGRLFRPLRGAARHAAMSASTATTIRSARPPSRPRCGCWRPSTPMRAPRTRACGRFRSRSAPAGRWSRSCARRRELPRRAPAGAGQRVHRRRRRRPPGIRQSRLWRARRVCALPRDQGLARRGRRCGAPGADQSRGGAGAGRRDGRGARAAAGRA